MTDRPIQLDRTSQPRRPDPCDTSRTHLRGDGSSIRIDPAETPHASQITGSSRAQFCCLHLGLPKTASSSLQANLFWKHSDLEYLGLIFPKTPLGSRLEDSGRILQRVHDCDVSNAEVARDRRAMRELLAPSMNAGRIPTYSYEILCSAAGSRERHARQYRELLGDCKILMLVRHPYAFAESLYQTHSIGFNRYPPFPWWRVPKGQRAQYRDYRQWLSKMFGKPPRIFDIQTWFERMWQPPAEPSTDLTCLRYAETADIYAEVFGRDAVRVILFEQLVEDADRVVANICDFLGIDAEEGVRLMRTKRENERWTTEHVKRIKELERSPLKSMLFRWMSPRQRRKMMRLGRWSQQEDAPKARATVPDVWKEHLNEYTREQNRRLLEDWGLPVDQYDYPM